MGGVLVTGASGFVGRHALAALVDAGHEVHATARRRPEDPRGARWHELDLSDSDETAALLAKVRPERLLHLAWAVPPGAFWTSTANVGWVQASLGLYRAFVEAGGTRAVMAGSCAEYDWRVLSGPDAATIRCHERDTPRCPQTLYGACKHATHLVGGGLAEQTETALAWGRLFFLYGPAEHPDRLVASVARSLLAGRDTPTTDGGQLRDFMHVADAGAALAALLDSGVFGAVNIASGEATTVRSVVQALAEEAGRPDLVRWGAIDRRPGDPEAIVADASRLRDEVGFRRTTALGEGLADTLQWWREHPEP